MSEENTEEKAVEATEEAVVAEVVEANEEASEVL